MNFIYSKAKCTLQLDIFYLNFYNLCLFLPVNRLNSSYSEQQVFYNSGHTLQWQEKQSYIISLVFFLLSRGENFDPANVIKKTSLAYLARVPNKLERLPLGGLSSLSDVCEAGLSLTD
jgi:hypothetical protein